MNCNSRRKTVILRFWAPFGGSGTTYAVYLRLIEKCVVNFLLIELAKKVNGRRPYYVKIWTKLTHPLQKRWFPINIRS